MAAREAGIELRERLEQTARCRAGDADAGVAHGEAHLAVPRAELEPHLAGVGELHGVAGEVDEDLPHLVDVARHANRRVGNDDA